MITSINRKPGTLVVEDATIKRIQISSASQDFLMLPRILCIFINSYNQSYNVLNTPVPGIFHNFKVKSAYT